MERHDQDEFSVPANFFPINLVEYLMVRPVKNPLSPEITLSINLLLDTIMTELQLDPSNSKSSHRNVTTFKTNRLSRWASPITWRMRKDGWCQYNISMLHERLNSSGLCFASEFERPLPYSSHPAIRVTQVLNSGAITEPSKDDGVCTHYRCAQTILKPEEYATKHVDSCSGCVDMVADRNEVHDILLKQGTFPLVLVIDEDDEEINLHPYDDSVSYVAISHVWSDGLGNLSRNALPKCQMLRLSRYVRGLEGEDTKGILLFWLDTLCVPPDPIEQNEQILNAQEMAIALMRKTYEDARAVLVLDSWLLTHPIANIQPTEVLMRIVSSNWNTRLWTLQEGALARKLLFQFGDVAFDSELGIEDMLHERSTVPTATLHTTIVQCFEDIRALVWNDMSRPNLVALMHALKIRSTSVASDEALCLAALMKVDLAQVIKAPEEQRMRTFWSLVKEAPQWIIFYTGVKLQDPGYRWAPRSFLRPQSRLQDIRTNLPLRSQANILGQVTRDGLRVSFAGLDLHIHHVGPIQGAVFFCNDAGQYFEGTIPQEQNAEKIAGMFHHDHARFFTQMEGTSYLVMDVEGFLKANRACWRCIRGRPAVVLHVVLQHEAALSMSHCSGLLAAPSDRRSQDGSINIHGICRINISRLGTADECIKYISGLLNIPTNDFQPVSGGFQRSNGTIFPIADSIFSSSPSWCVD
jgi:hypothetical protein